MWQTKYASDVPKNLELGFNFRPCSKGYFLSGFSVFCALTYEGFKISLCFGNVCLVSGFLQCRTRIGDVTDLEKIKSYIKSQTKILKKLTLCSILWPPPAWLLAWSFSSNRFSTKKQGKKPKNLRRIG